MSCSTRLHLKQPLVHVALAVAALLLATTHVRSAADPQRIPRKSVVHIYPHKLTAQDKLVDGLSAKTIEITAETTLIWIDRAPGARYAHDTEYVLISPGETRVIKGQWWPTLNGKDILRGDTAEQFTGPV